MKEFENNFINEIYSVELKQLKLEIIYFGNQNFEKNKSSL